jgi:hypothetical protein
MAEALKNENRDMPFFIISQVKANSIDTVKKLGNCDFIGLRFFDLADELERKERKGIITNPYIFIFKPVFGDSYLRRGLIVDSYKLLTPNAIKFLASHLKRGKSSYLEREINLLIRVYCELLDDFSDLIKKGYFFRDNAFEFGFSLFSIRPFTIFNVEKDPSKYLIESTQELNQDKAANDKEIFKPFNMPLSYRDIFS